MGSEDGYGIVAYGIGNPGYLKQDGKEYQYKTPAGFPGIPENAYTYATLTFFYVLCIDIQKNASEKSGLKR